MEGLRLDLDRPRTDQQPSWEALMRVLEQHHI